MSRPNYPQNIATSHLLDVLPTVPFGEQAGGNHRQSGNIHQAFDAAAAVLIGAQADMIYVGYLELGDRNTYEGAHDVHALILGRAITGFAAF